MKSTEIDCDCFIGYLCGEEVTKSELEQEVQRTIEAQKNFKRIGLLKGEFKTKNQILDGRSGYLGRFVYCPYCGIKINWKEIIKTENSK